MLTVQRTPQKPAPAPGAGFLVPVPRPNDRQTATQRGYGYRWQKARKVFLSKHRLCAECERQGRTTLATVVDHIRPHRQDRKRFWNRNNWQPLCKGCHDAHKGLGR